MYERAGTPLGGASIMAFTVAFPGFGGPGLGRNQQWGGVVAPVSLGNWTYVGVLGFILLASLWLEVIVRTRVLRRWRRLLLTLILPVAIFTIWDAYAIAAGHWTFDASRTLGWEVVAGVPIDEVLFFVTIPLASALTLEAVRASTGWQAGDEEQ